jgi:L-cystine uptake protein TcyP (sodium:dicarboxylate symporter family)
MIKQIWRNLMSFKNIFKDDNDVNEKNVIGFMAFAVMVLFALADLVTGYVGKDLVVQEFIYNSFVIVTLGCFGIAGIEKFAKK